LGDVKNGLIRGIVSNQVAIMVAAPGSRRDDSLAAGVEQSRALPSGGERGRDLPIRKAEISGRPRPCSRRGAIGEATSAAQRVSGAWSRAVRPNYPAPAQSCDTSDAFLLV